MGLFKKIFSSIHPTMTFIILVINISLFLGVLSLVNYIQKNANKWINTAEKKVNDKIDEIKEEIPGIIQESMSGGFGY
tara:strand:+ start:36 stop:269 length:234 start_codon:yes stop_codon:yes gene_type:complete